MSIWNFIPAIILAIAAVAVWVYLYYRNYIKFNGNEIDMVLESLIPQAEAVLSFDINPKKEGVVFYSFKDDITMYVRNNKFYIDNGSITTELKSAPLDVWTHIEIPRKRYTELYIGGAPTKFNPSPGPPHRVGLKNFFTGELKNVKLGNNIITETLVQVEFT